MVQWIILAEGGSSFCSRKFSCVQNEDILFYFHYFRRCFIFSSFKFFTVIEAFKVFLHQRIARMRAWYLHSIMAIHDHIVVRETVPYLSKSIVTIHPEQDHVCSDRTISHRNSWYSNSSISRSSDPLKGHWDLLPYSNVMVSYRDSVLTNTNSFFKISFTCREKRATGKTLGHRWNFSF